MSSRISEVFTMLVMAAVTVGAFQPANAQPSDIKQQLAPTGTLRVGVLMVGYFAVPALGSGRLKGVIPDLGEELARRIGVPAQLIRFEKPGAIIEAFRHR